MKLYTGFRHPFDGAVVTVIGEESATLLDPRWDLWNHSPSGFEWGYGGSGPAQLALALLADALGADDLAVHLHQKLKSQWVACLERRGWMVTDGFLSLWACRALYNELIGDDAPAYVAEDLNGD